MIRKPGAVQSPIQEFPAPVSRECAPGAVPSMSRRRQADDQDPRVRIPEPGDGATPVHPIAEGGAFRAGDSLAVSHEPRTLAACDNFGGHAFQAIRRHRAPESVSSQKRAPEETAKSIRRPPSHGEEIIVSKSQIIRFSRVVDLSQAIGPDTQMFPAYPPPTFTQWTTREVHGFFAESLFLISHTGTHVDAPFHFEPKGRKLHQMPLDRFIVPGHVLDVRGLPKKGRILPTHLQSSIRTAPRPYRNGDAILLRTGWWERHRGTRAYLFENPGLTRAAANLLLDLGVGLVGIDTANIDHPDDATYPAHHALLAANVPVIENVANLSALGSSAFFLLALPLNLQGTSGSPIRLVALAE